MYYCSAQKKYDTWEEADETAQEIALCMASFAQPLAEALEYCTKDGDAKSNSIQVLVAIFEDMKDNLVNYMKYCDW